MRRALLLFILLLIGLFTGCSDNRDELYATIETQAERIEELEQTIQAQMDLQQEHLDAVAQMQVDAETNDEPLWHGLTEAQVREDFFQHAEGLVRNVVGEVRSDLGPLQAEEVALIISDITVLAIVPNASLNQSAVLLFYRRDWDNDGEITWTVTGYGATFFVDPLDDITISPAPYIISAREPAAARQLTNLETVTLPFFYEAWTYPVQVVEETILGRHLWEETIRLVREHYDVQIRDIWYEGTRLYVEMMPIMAGSFNVGFGSILHGESVRRTFEAFPNVTDVRFLVLGRRFTAGYNGFDINCTCGGWAAGLEIGVAPCTCIWR